MADILLLEDDRALCGGIKIALSKDSHNVLCSYTVSEAEQILKGNCFDLLLLDINLPDGSGLELCKKIHKASDTPVIFITANDTETDMLEGFKCGCDDYVAKPFSSNVLRQKVIALLRRVNNPQQKNIMSYNDLRIDFDAMTANVCGKDCKLTATEFRLLEYMAHNKGRVLTRAMLLEHIWDIDENFVDENTLSVHIKRLRDKLESDNKNPRYIKTVFGIGYTFGE